MKAEMWKYDGGIMPSGLRIYVMDDEDRVVYGSWTWNPAQAGDDWHELLAGVDPVEDGWACGLFEDRDFFGMWGDPDDELLDKIRATRDRDIDHQYEPGAAVLVAEIENGKEMTLEPKEMDSFTRHALGFKDDELDWMELFESGALRFQSELDIPMSPKMKTYRNSVQKEEDYSR